MLKQIQQWLFPNICCLCENYTETEQDLCLVCKNILPWIEDRCYRCGLMLEHTRDAIYCTRCQENPPAFDRLCALFSYTPPVTQLITGLKFNEQLSYGTVLGELLAESVGEIWYKNDLPQALIPVPLHEKRLRKRGYNQALELIWPVYKRYRIPLLLNSCMRLRQTRPQSTLNKNHRQRNLQGVFSVTVPPLLEHIAIVDDVVTTGSTVAALSHALKVAGVERVDVWCICRA